MTSGERELPQAASSPILATLKSEARATLDTWRERGEDRLDPVRFHFIDALERRACGHEGAPRRVMDERLATLMAEYAEVVELAASASSHASSDTVAQKADSAPLTLAGLTDRLASHAVMAVSSGSSAARDGDPRASYPELGALDYFREVWAKVRTDKQLRQSLEQVPGNAGPLNSSSLVHRSLSLMRELSPGYLKQFLAYVDALSWMEQMGGGAVPAKETPRAGGPAKSTVKSATRNTPKSAGKTARNKSR